MLEAWWIVGARRGAVALGRDAEAVRVHGLDAVGVGLRLDRRPVIGPRRSRQSRRPRTTDPRSRRSSDRSGSSRLRPRATSSGRPHRSAAWPHRSGAPSRQASIGNGHRGDRGQPRAWRCPHAERGHEVWRRCRSRCGSWGSRSWPTQPSGRPSLKKFSSDLDRPDVDLPERGVVRARRSPRRSGSRATSPSPVVGHAARDSSSPRPARRLSVPTCSSKQRSPSPSQPNMSRLTTPR